MRRLKRTAWLFVGLTAVVLFQSSWIQIWKRDDYLKRRPAYRKKVELFARRGLIYDRNLAILAMDLPTYTVAADLTVMGEIQRAASVFSRVLGGRREEYLSLMQKNRSDAFVCIQKGVSEAQKAELTDSRLKGLVINPSRQRVQPCKALAIQVIGLTNVEHRGIAGIEQQMESVLAGEDGSEVLQVDGRNRAHSSPDDPVQIPKDGNHIVLTLDQTYQTLLEEEIRRGVGMYRAAGGSGVLMDPFSGEILGMASLNASAVEDGSSTDLMAELQNRAVQTAFEPGSTLKVVTAAAALEEKLYNPETTIYCENGSFKFSGQVIHDHEQKYGLLTFSQVLEYSSNIGISKICKKMGRKQLYRSLQNFGFGTKTSVDLPGETAGFLPPVYKWSDFSTATIGFGQGISVTTLQLACMLSVIANGGELVKPQIVKSILDLNGDELVPFKREVIRRVVSTETAGRLAVMLENAVRLGSGTEARVEGVRVAGKTGTAQKSIPGVKGYVPGTYTSSFAGFWPVEAPRYVLVVVLEEPKESYWAGHSAAPVFAKVVERMTGLPSAPRIPKEEGPDRTREVKFIFSSEEKIPEPRPSSDSGKRTVNDSPYHVPDVVGYSLRQALQELAKRQIEARVEGEGIVVKQFPESGRRIEAGMVCTLSCARVRKTH